MPIQKNCKSCQKQFEVSDKHLEFYDKISPKFSGTGGTGEKKYKIPSPTLCPRCRQQRRLSFRNEINLYTRKCDYSGKDIISMYSPNNSEPNNSGTNAADANNSSDTNAAGANAGKALKIYDQEIWWSDKWNPKSFGRDYDFSKPFFEQFAALQKEVPRMSLNNISNENSYYTNYSFRNKNSYLIFTADYNEDCFYGRFSDKNFHSSDFDFTFDSTYCYELTDCKGDNACKFSQKVSNSSDLTFCYNMKSCNSCIFCANLRMKNHCIFNKQVTQEEFEKFKKEMNLSSYSELKKAEQTYKEFLKTIPRKYLEILKCENSVGDYLKSSKNANECFDSFNLEDVEYCSQVYNLKDSMDWDFIADKSELCYEMVSAAVNIFNSKFCSNCWDGNSDLMYCDLCLGNSKCFGCIGLRKQKFCILNKQYTEEEYNALVPKIIEHMTGTGEWGEFFPASLSPFAYNESVAFEYMPVTKKEALAKEYKPQTYEIPDSIENVPESITNEVLSCKDCGKNYKIIKTELEFYKQIGVPIPRECFNCRHKKRMGTRNGRILHDRNCSKCGTTMKTTYSPEEQAPIYCEKCYLEDL